MKKWRKVTSLTALWSFGLLVLTSVILYIVPAGRVAYWADWHLWGLTKTQWGDLHINLGVLFLAAMGMHIYLNWSSIVAYMKTKAKSLRIFTPDFNAAMVITMIVALGTYWELPPFSTVIAFSQSIKDSAAEKYGEPPYGHAELSSLKTLNARMGWDQEVSLERLARQGIRVDGPQQTLQAIAALNDMTPQQVYMAMQPEETPGRRAQLPDMPPAGIGRRSLADICQEYQLNIPELMRKLKDHQIAAAADQPLKEIAVEHQMAPQDLYDLVKRLTEVIGD
ncbi:MAG: DUF4405 domain-containing protein [Desulfobacteraceae bacterium]|jgi:hypothetical protein